MPEFFAICLAVATCLHVGVAMSDTVGSDMHCHFTGALSDPFSVSPAEGETGWS